MSFWSGLKSFFGLSSHDEERPVGNNHTASGSFPAGSRGQTVVRHEDSGRREQERRDREHREQAHRERERREQERRREETRRERERREREAWLTAQKALTVPVLCPSNFRSDYPTSEVFAEATHGWFRPCVVTDARAAVVEANKRAHPVVGFAVHHATRLNANLKTDALAELVKEVAQSARPVTIAVLLMRLGNDQTSAAKEVANFCASEGIDIQYVRGFSIYYQGSGFVDNINNVVASELQALCQSTIEDFPAAGDASTTSSAAVINSGLNVGLSLQDQSVTRVPLLCTNHMRSDYPDLVTLNKELFSRGGRFAFDEFPVDDSGAAADAGKVIAAGTLAAQSLSSHAHVVIAILVHHATRLEANLRIASVEHLWKLTEGRVTFVFILMRLGRDPVNSEATLAQLCSGIGIPADRVRSHLRRANLLRGCPED